MNVKSQRKLNEIWRGYTRFIDRFAIWVILIFILLSCGAVYYAAHHLGINSDTADMFDASLGFRNRQNKFNKAFPLTRRNLIFVIETPNPEATAGIAQKLVSQLRNNIKQFESVYVPGGGPFFKKNKLLFLPKSQLDTVAIKLKRSQVLFSLLSQNYSLRGLLAFVDQVLSMGNKDQISQLNRMFGEINHTIQAGLQGHHFVMSWQRIMTSKKQAGNQNIQFILVKPHFDYSRLIAAKPAIETARDIINTMNLQKNASIRITGNVAMSYEELKSVMHGTIIAGILAFFLVGLTLWIGLRSIRLIVAAIFTLLAGLALTVGFSALAVGQLNMISVAFAILYVGLGIDYAIHFTLQFNAFIYNDYSPLKSLYHSFKALSSSLLLSTISTALGFYAFVPTSFSGVSELGIIAGTGMIISLVVTFTFLPGLLSILYAKPHKTSSVLLSAPCAGIISSFQIKHASLLRKISVGAGVISILLLFKIHFDYNPINLRNPDTESIRTLKKLMHSKAFTPWTVDIMSDDSVTVKRQAKELKKSAVISRVITLFSFIPKNQQEKLSVIHSLKPRYEHIPPAAKDSASYIISNQIAAIRNFKTQIKKYDKPKSSNFQKLHATLQQLLDTLSAKSLGQQKKLITKLEHDLLATFPATLQDIKESLKARPITLSTLPNNLRKRWQSNEGAYRLNISPAPKYDKNNQTRRSFASTVLKTNPNATGNLITVMKSGDTVKYAFMEAMTYAFIVITLLLIVYLRSFKYTMYVLLPITLAGIMTCGAMVLLGLQFNFANIIALPLLMGLGVDNGIHIVHQAKSNAIDSVHMLRTSTARAIIFSALTTLFSFGNLAFSPHRGTSSMGIILTIGLFFIIFTTLIILPAFLLKKEL